MVMQSPQLRHLEYLKTKTKSKHRRILWVRPNFARTNPRKRNQKLGMSKGMAEAVGLRI